MARELAKLLRGKIKFYNKNSNKLCERTHDLTITNCAVRTSLNSQQITARQNQGKTRKQPIQTTDPDANEIKCSLSLVKDPGGPR